MITLPEAPFVTGAVIKQGSYGGDPRSVTTLLQTLTPFKSQGAMHAHRYNGTGVSTMAPPSGGGKLPREYTIPATAVYVVFSYSTPIGWVDADGTRTIPDVRYSVTTTQHQGKVRAWMGRSVPGVVIE